ncbi:hypothetical protein [Amycolatopsis pigmentata]|uniref:Uncharacterized protein n=1 Tax=Amycolatopsis pigmentata TaxID=450801 RepID=A0ABW5FMG2_9PSEU
MTHDLTDESARDNQRIGEVVERQPFGSGQQGRTGTYFVRDEETGTHYSFNYMEIVTEGFRTIRVGERVRFFLDPDQPTHARYVIRLDQPEIEEFYR